MRLVLQRVKWARVTVDARTAASIGRGILLLAGFGLEDDTGMWKSTIWKKIITKVVGLRIFPDQEDRMNLSLQDLGGEILAVSQFTLYADCGKGRRPSFTAAAPPKLAEDLFHRLVSDLEKVCPGRVRQGVFGAAMDVDFCNWGPVTLVMESGDFQ
ncbi:MAG: D-aminoacyl-tRNA deacylase [Desulfovibrionales bacterium]